MKTLKIYLKAVALFLSALMILQSCTVYKSTPVTLDEAVKADTKVKIEKRNGEKLKYYKIVQGEDGNYYGDEKVNGLHNNILINGDEIEKIQIKDKSTSTILTISIPVAWLGIGIVVLALSAQNIGFSHIGN
ncbi:hypothetical protein [Tamlana flava]|uniref:hypothetical protein n=1 Tax=Tamlana flava TaxID=3158572 RepID=UPI00351B1675